VLWSQTPQTADIATAKAVIKADAQLMAGGPGWTSARLPKGAVCVGSLHAALQRLTGS